jgi:hypothetical protein
MTGIIPIVTAFIAICGGAFAYWNQKRLDRSNALIEMRRDAYRNFISSMIAATSAQSQDSSDAGSKFERFQIASGDMTVVASDEVLKRLAAFQLDRTKSTLSIDSSFKDLLQSMRKDVFEHSTATMNDIEHSFPIKFGEKQ